MDPLVPLQAGATRHSMACNDPPGGKVLYLGISVRAWGCRSPIPKEVAPESVRKAPGVWSTG